MDISVNARRERDAMFAAAADDNTAYFALC
jgi:hypothetical protein